MDFTAPNKVHDLFPIGLHATTRSNLHAQTGCAHRSRMTRLARVLTPADNATRGRRFALFCQPDSSHIRPMAKNPDPPKKPAKTPKSKAPNSRAPFQGVEARRAADRAGAGGTAQSRDQSRREPASAPATGLQPPPDNSWDRRAGGEAAAHRARASTRGTSEDVAKRDAATKCRCARIAMLPSPLLPRAKRVVGRGRGWGVVGRRALSAEQRVCRSHPPPPTPPRRFAEGGEKKPRPGLARVAPQREFAPANYGTAATIPTLDPELAKQLGFTTEEEDAAAMARPPRNKMEALGRRRHRGCAGSADPRRPPRIQGRGRPDQDLDAAPPAAPGKIRRRRALRHQVRLRAEGRPADRDRRTGRGHRAQRPHAGAARRHRLAARPTPWPR